MEKRPVVVDDASDFVERSKKVKFDITHDDEDDLDDVNFTAKNIQIKKLDSEKPIELTQEDINLIEKVRQAFERQYTTVEEFDSNTQVWIDLSSLIYNLFYYKLINTSLFLLNILCDIIKQEKSKASEKIDSLLHCLFNKKYSFKKNTPRPLLLNLKTDTPTNYDAYFKSKIKTLIIKIQNIFTDYNTPETFNISNVRDSSVLGGGLERLPAACLSLDKPLLIRVDVKKSIDGKNSYLVPYYKEEDEALNRRIKQITNIDVTYEANLAVAKNNMPKIYDTTDQISVYTDNEIILASLDSIYIVNRQQYKTIKAYLNGSVCFKNTKLLPTIREFDL